MINIFNDWLMDMLGWYVATDPYEEETEDSEEENDNDEEDTIVDPVVIINNSIFKNSRGGITTIEVRYYE